MEKNGDGEEEICTKIKICSDTRIDFVIHRRLLGQEGSAGTAGTAAAKQDQAGLSR
ncbi:aconitase [Paenibacillus sp. NAIST15-1]|nr:aconitase [Paenibacillus sp. NAIST15-1]